MLSLVENWRSSDLMQKAFCGLYYIMVATVAYWIALSKESAKMSNGFVMVSPPPEMFKGEHIEIIYPTRVRLKLGHDLRPIAQLI